MLNLLVALQKYYCKRLWFRSERAENAAARETEFEHLQHKPFQMLGVLVRLLKKMNFMSKMNLICCWMMSLMMSRACDEMGCEFESTDEELELCSCGLLKNNNIHASGQLQSSRFLCNPHFFLRILLIAADPWG